MHEKIIQTIYHHYFYLPIISAFFAYLFAIWLRICPNRTAFFILLTPSDDKFEKLHKYNYAVFIVFYILKRISQSIFEWNGLLMLSPASIELTVRAIRNPKSSQYKIMAKQIRNLEKS